MMGAGPRISRAGRHGPARLRERRATGRRPHRSSPEASISPRYARLLALFVRPLPPARAAHRCVRQTALAAVVAGVAGVAGADPQASFDAGCARLPTSRFEVTAVPLDYGQDETQSIDQLNLRSGHTPGIHLTFGLTTANFGHQTQMAIRLVEDSAGARACGTVDVQVRLSMQPVTVYLAQELDGSPCARTATMEHELMHVAVFRAVLDETARDLGAELADAVGSGLQRAASQAELQRQVKSRIDDTLSGLLLRRQRELDRRQTAVDSPREYARVRDACAR